MLLRYLGIISCILAPACAMAGDAPASGKIACSEHSIAAPPGAGGGRNELKLDDFPNTGLSSLKGVGSIDRLANGAAADATGGPIRHRTVSIVDRDNVASDGSGSGNGGGCTVACQNNLNPAGGGTQAYGTGVYGPSAGSAGPGVQGGARVAVGDVNNGPASAANNRTLTVGGAKTESVQGLSRK